MRFTQAIWGALLLSTAICLPKAESAAVSKKDKSVISDVKNFFRNFYNDFLQGDEDAEREHQLLKREYAADHWEWQFSDEAHKRHHYEGQGHDRKLVVESQNMNTTHGNFSRFYDCVEDVVRDLAFAVQNYQQKPLVSLDNCMPWWLQSDFSDTLHDDAVKANVWKHQLHEAVDRAFHDAQEAFKEQGNASVSLEVSMPVPHNIWKRNGKWAKNWRSVVGKDDIEKFAISFKNFTKNFFAHIKDKTKQPINLEEYYHPLAAVSLNVTAPIAKRGRSNGGGSSKSSSSSSSKGGKGRLPFHIVLSHTKKPCVNVTVAGTKEKRTTKLHLYKAGANAKKARRSVKLLNLRSSSAEAAPSGDCSEAAAGGKGYCE